MENSGNSGKSTTAPFIPAASLSLPVLGWPSTSNTLHNSSKSHSSRNANGGRATKYPALPLVSVVSFSQIIWGYRHLIVCVSLRLSLLHGTIYDGFVQEYIIDDIMMNPMNCDWLNLHMNPSPQTDRPLHTSLGYGGNKPQLLIKKHCKLSSDTEQAMSCDWQGTASR